MTSLSLLPRELLWELDRFLEYNDISFTDFRKGWHVGEICSRVYFVGTLTIRSKSLDVSYRWGDTCDQLINFLDRKIETISLLYGTEQGRCSICSMRTGKIMWKGDEIEYSDNLTTFILSRYEAKIFVNKLREKVLQLVKI